jgi:hypothetical protein
MWEAVIAHADWSPELLSALAAIRAGSRQAARERFFSDHSRFFAHYTSADTVKKVLDSRGFYMRNSRLMNDHSEVSHGFQMVLTAVSETGGGSQYKAAWSSVEPRLGERLPQLIAESAGKVMDDCFIISVSEHLAADDDGLLSMWRAYGTGDLRVALVARPGAVAPMAEAGVFLTACLYGDVHDVGRELGGKAAVLSRHAGAFRDLSPALIEQLALGDAVNFAVSIKHPGFAEEREWRFVYVTDFPSPEMNARREAVVWGGIPQVVYKLPIILPCDAGWTPDRLSLERIILGPCAESRTVRRGLVQLLGDYSFDNAEDIVRASSIPYRQKM